MSTPIKPPGGASSHGVTGAGDGPDRGRVEARSGELRALVEDAEAGTDSTAVEHAGAAAPSHLGAIERDLASGRIDVDEAVEQLVSRALDRASALPVEQRAELEAQLRAALREDPTLIALQKDLERGSPS